MRYSTNYHMNKPELNEQYRLDHWNSNTDIIDTQLKANADNLSTHENNTSNPHEVTKAQVGLGNVENTALSTWSGSSNLSQCNQGNFGNSVTKNVDTSADITSVNVPTTGMAISCGNASVVCNSAMEADTKTVSINGFTLYEGVRIKVCFKNGWDKDNNTDSSTFDRLKLNVNNTGAFYIASILDYYNSEDTYFHDGTSYTNQKILVRPSFVNFRVVGKVTQTSSIQYHGFDKFTTLELMYITVNNMRFNDVSISGYTNYAPDKTFYSGGIWLITNKTPFFHKISEIKDTDNKINFYLESTLYSDGTLEDYTLARKYNNNVYSKDTSYMIPLGLIKARGISRAIANVTNRLSLNSTGQFNMIPTSSDELGTSVRGASNTYTEVHARRTQNIYIYPMS